MTDTIKCHVVEITIIAIAVVMGAIRPFLAPHPVSLQGSYEAFAHLFVGGVFVPGWSAKHAGCW